MGLVAEAFATGDQFKSNRVKIEGRSEATSGERERSIAVLTRAVGSDGRQPAGMKRLNTAARDLVSHQDPTSDKWKADS